MSNFQRLAIATIAAILGAEIQTLATAPTPALSEGDCVYHWGDMNRAAERVGAAAYREMHGYGAVYSSATDPSPAPVAGTNDPAQNAYPAAAAEWGAN